MQFHINITIFSVLWVVLSFIQSFKMGLWSASYVLLTCGAVFLYNNMHIILGYSCIILGLVCLVWLLIKTRKQYDKYKYNKI